MIVVVTALIGPAEAVGVPVKSPDVHYVCFTDRSDVNGWERCPVPHGDPRRIARHVKTSVSECFPTADVTIWIDASFDLLKDPAVIVDDAAKLGRPIVAFAHPDRNRIRDEGVEIVRIGLADADSVGRQLADYKRAGFDTDDHPQRVLTTTGFMVRWRTPYVGIFNHVWHEQIEKHTLRDQLSVDYSAWRASVKIGYLPGHYRDNAYVRYNRERHNQRRAA